MNRNFLVSAILTSAVLATAAGVSADVISGPTIDTALYGRNISGLEFKALDESVLSSFVFQNQGKVDTIDLTDSSGQILKSVNTDGIASELVTVDWSLSAGHTYFLLQTTNGNGKYATFNKPLPSDSDLGIVSSGVFGDDFFGAITNIDGYPSNAYYADFNAITTTAPAGAGGVPEPAAWAMMLVGFGGLGALSRRNRMQAFAA